MALFLSGKWRWSEASNFWGTLKFQTSSMQPHVDKIESGCNTWGRCKKTMSTAAVHSFLMSDIIPGAAVHHSPNSDSNYLPDFTQSLSHQVTVKCQWWISDWQKRLFLASSNPVVAQTWKKVAADTVLHLMFAKFCKFSDKHSNSLSQPPSPPSTATSHSTRFLMHSLRRLEQVNSFLPNINTPSSNPCLSVGSINLYLFLGDSNFEFHIICLMVSSFNPLKNLANWWFQPPWKIWIRQIGSSSLLGFQ